MKPAALPLPHITLGVAIAFVWGTNFVIIRGALQVLPPLLLGALRFTFVLLPAVFFFKKPDVPWRTLILYGLLIGVGQFGLVYLAMDGHISAGLTSLVAQSQVFFTIGFAMVLMKERLRPYQGLALALGAAGIVVILAHTSPDATPLGVGMVLTGGACWGLANIVAKGAAGIDILAFVVWSSLFSAPPLLALALFVEGWTAVRDGLLHAGWAGWGAVIWQSVGNTLFAFAAWGWLLARHEAALVAPMALLVPVVGMAAAAILVGESLPGWKLAAAALVLSGLALNVLWPAFAAKRAA